MTATELADVKVGDPLFLVSAGRNERTESVTVSRIGRQYLYVARRGHEMNTQFHRDTGVAKENVGWKRYLVTPERYEELKLRASLFDSLRAAGIEVKWEAQDSLTTDQLRQLLAVVQPAA